LTPARFASAAVMLLVSVLVLMAAEASYASYSGRLLQTKLNLGVQQIAVLKFFPAILVWYCHGQTGQYIDFTFIYLHFIFLFTHTYVSRHFPHNINLLAN
jgi:hypothetical protein